MIKELKKSDWYDRYFKAITIIPSGEEVIERWMKEKLTIKEVSVRG